MINKDKIAYYLNVFKELRLEDIYDAWKLIKIVKLQPNDIFIKEGSNQKVVGYIEKGLIRAFTINSKGEEISVLLRWEGQFVASHDNVLFDKPSKYCYQAIEPTEIIQLNYNVLQEIIDKNPNLEKSRKKFLLEMLSETLEMLESFVLLSPEERYIRFVSKNPNIVNRVPNKYIAHLLGITPVSLSRIRKRIISKKH